MNYDLCPVCQHWPCRCPAIDLPEETLTDILRCLERIEKLIKEANFKTMMEFYDVDK